MKCNACMSRTLVEHVCREKCLEDNCPICHEYIFTSSSPVKALPCGHLMHSTCFQVLNPVKIYFTLVMKKVKHMVMLRLLGLFSLILVVGVHMFTLHMPCLQQVAWRYAGQLHHFKAEYCFPYKTFTKQKPFSHRSTLRC